MPHNRLVNLIFAGFDPMCSTPSGAQFVARQNDRTGLHAGETVSLDIDASQAHWFDTAGRVIARAAA